jgi:hypothetical protein
MAKEKDSVVVEEVKAPKGEDLSNLSEAELKKIANPSPIRRIGEPVVKTKRQMLAVIELYKRSNPAKFEVKKKALEEQLANCPN